MLNEELSDKRTSVLEVKEVESREASRFLVRRPLKRNWNRRKSLLNRLRRVGDTGADVYELQYGKIPELEKQLEAATQLEGKTMRVCCVIK